MKLSQIDLKQVRLPLVRPFRTSSSVKDHLEHILVRVETTDGAVGWGEVASPSDPFYCPETVETCWHLLHDFLGRMVLNQEWESIDELIDSYRLVKGNRFAKAGLEMACSDLAAKVAGVSLSEFIGGVRPKIASGVSLGIPDDLAILLDQIAQYLEEGYRRIKLKIAPGADIQIVEAVRQQYPEIPLQVDANSAYTLNDLQRLRALDDFGLLLIEQPLSDDDIVDHARLQEQLRTPICLDESIHSVADARKALELGACRVINIKVSRVGGLIEARRIHDLCYSRGIPVWCGGMHEFGIGRAANLAIASLPGFVLPGDLSGSDKYYKRDLVEPPIRAVDGYVTVPSKPGIGVEIVESRLSKQITREATLAATS